ncbi:MAG: ParA family protein [Anaerolineales bacterium]|nr:ParA family protein [Anaerolineales bacterium]
MTRVIVVANQKGGVGKTTLVNNLGAALAEAGQKVILVDLDPQSALTAGLGFDPYTLSRTAYTLLTRESTSLASVLRPVGPNLVLVPGSVDLAAAEYQMAETPDQPYRLRNALARSRVPADFVLIDTPPSLGLLTVNGLVAATELLVPVQCQYLAMRGVRGLLESIWLIHERLNPDLNLLGVLATLYRNGSDHAREVLDELRAVFEHKLFDTVIEDEDAVAKAPVASKSVLAYQPNSAAAAAFRRLAQEVLHVH